MSYCTRNSELDRAIHVKRRGKNKAAACPSSGLDLVRRRVAVHPMTKSDENKYESKTNASFVHCTEKSLQLKDFEKKYKAFIAAADKASAEALFDDVYHDGIVHMMDGIPMDKTALKNHFDVIFDQGTKMTVSKFRVMGDQIESVVTYTSNEHMNFRSRSLLTLKEGKIIRAERIESAAGTV